MRQSHSHVPGAGVLTIIGTRLFGDRAIIFSTETLSGSGQMSATPMTNIDFVSKDLSGWNSSYGGGIETSAISPVPPSLVCGESTVGTDVMGNFSAVYGKVRLPTVASVEVDFSGGQTVKDATQDGVFAVMLTSLSVPTKLRVLDVNGHTLHSVTLPQIPLPSSQPSTGQQASSDIHSLPFACSP